MRIIYDYQASLTQISSTVAMVDIFMHSRVKFNKSYSQLPVLLATSKMKIKIRL